MLRALQAADSGEAGLVVDGQAFVNPAGLVEIREKQCVATEDRLPERPDAARAIEVEDVRELVGDD